jgi:hypothetical protein
MLCHIAGHTVPNVVKELQSFQTSGTTHLVTASHPRRYAVQQYHCENLKSFNHDILQGWIQTWYSDCQEQLGALNKQIYDVWQQEESVCQEVDADKPIKISVTATDIRSLLESKEQLLSQAEGKFWGCLCIYICVCYVTLCSVIGCHHSG